MSFLSLFMLELRSRKTPKQTEKLEKSSYKKVNKTSLILLMKTKDTHIRHDKDTTELPSFSYRIFRGTNLYV